MIVKIYTQAGCTSSRKALNWLKENGLYYHEKRITASPLTLEEFQEILRMTEEGTDDVIATNSNDFKRMNLDFEQLTIQELHALILVYPRLLRSPILIDSKRLQVGFNEMDIRAFMPRKTRVFEFARLGSSV